MNEEERNKLWESYTKNRSDQTRETIIMEYVPLVKVVAGRLSMYLGYAVEYEDMVSYGIFGLIDAIDKFNYQNGNKFETYASLRIRGSILDQIRKMDWIPRSVRQKQKQMESAIAKLESEKNGVVRDEDLANELEISVDELYSWQGQITGLSSLDEYYEQGNEVYAYDSRKSEKNEPEAQIEQMELKKKISGAYELLKENEKKVISLYYYEELTIKEISRILELSESRISQIHTKALTKMKEYLGSDIGILFA